MYKWCHDRKNWASDNWKSVMSDESYFTLFPASGRVYVRRTPKEAFSLECLVPTVKHGGSVMVWGAISWYSAARVTTLHDRTLQLIMWTFRVKRSIA
jgi:hypothetical protein